MLSGGILQRSEPIVIAMDAVETLCFSVYIHLWGVLQKMNDVQVERKRRKREALERNPLRRFGVPIDRTDAALKQDTLPADDIEDSE